MARRKMEPIVIHTIGISGKVKEAHMGVIINGTPHALPGVDTVDQVRNMIQNNQIEDFLKGVFNG